MTAAVTVRFVDTRFTGIDCTPAEQIQLLHTMIAEGVLDLRDQFVSDLVIEVEGE